MQLRLQFQQAKSGHGGFDMAVKSAGKYAVWAIIGFAILGFGGFGVRNFSGGSTALGTVGSKTITVADYQRDLNRQIRAYEAQFGSAISFPVAQSMGIDRQVLGSLVTRRILDDEASRLGLSVGDATVRDQILQISAFNGIDGKFDRTAYTDLLKRQGYSEAGYETAVREETARNILQSAIVAGVAEPKVFADTLVNFVAERRDVTWALVTEANLQSPVPAPTDEDVAAYYAAHTDEFTTPETKVIQYARLSPDMLKDSVEVDETEIKDLYDQRIADFVQPERRLVERLGFIDTAAAQDALAQITAGATDFDTLVTDRGLDLSDVDLGDVGLDDLGAAGDAIFAATPGDVVGPFDTPIGPALFRMNAVLSAEETTFDEARNDLRDEIATSRARRQIDNQTSEINDLLAGGATIDDLAQRVSMDVGTIEWTANSTDGIAAYEGFRTAAAATKVGDYPTLTELDDGGVFVLTVQEVREPALQPLEDVLDQATAGAMRDATAKAITAEADRLAGLITAEAGFDATGLQATEETAITRRNFIPGTPATFLETVFGMEQGAVTTLPADGGTIIATVTGISAPDLDNPETRAQRSAIVNQVSQGIAQDIFEVYSSALRQNTAAKIDQSVVNAVNASFQ